MEASGQYPDPILTASFYCSGRLDEVLHQVVAPSWRVLQQSEPGSGAYLWTMRYGKGGEHLKVRLHGPGSLAHPARALLQQAAESFFARLGEPSGVRAPVGWKGAAAVDVDDEVVSDHPDRSLLWTRYRRSHVSLGGKPFLDDDGYAGRITRCLAAGCERVLLLAPDATGKVPHRARQSALLKALIGGLAALGFAADARSAYLAYHRDWLLRFTLARNHAEAGKTHDLLQLFDRRAEAMGPSADTLRRAARAEWARSWTAMEPEGEDAAWRRSLADLLGYISPLCADPDYHIDPFAGDPCFAPVFKVFHGLANQLGLNLIEEAFAHHLLRSVTGEPASRPAAAPDGAGITLEPSLP
jgi:hypothetical protein